MSYVIAKKANKVGSIALKMEHVPDLIMRDALLDDVKRYERYSDEAEE